MIALDTNVIVRFLVRDDEKQAALVYARFKKAEASRERLFVPLLVVLELIWVLDSAYDMSREKILGSIADLRQMPILEFESDGVLEHLLSSAKGQKADLADLLIAHAAEAAGCEAALTFDKKASRFAFFRILKADSFPVRKRLTPCEAREYR